MIKKKPPFLTEVMKQVQLNVITQVIKQAHSKSFDRVMNSIELNVITRYHKTDITKKILLNRCHEQMSPNRYH